MHGEVVLKGLLAFVAIAEHGSINRAAQAMNISQPSLTRTLQQFEAIIGGPVFDRKAKGVALNELGKRLLAHAQTIRAETVNVTRTIEAFRHEKRRQLHIGAVTAHPLVQFAEAVVEFMREEPDLFIRITHGSPEELMELLRQGTIEMVFGPVITGPDAKGLVQDTIYHDVINIYCGPDCAIAHVSQASLDDLSAAHWILPPVGTLARSKLSELFTETGRPDPVLAIEVENVPMRRSLVMRSQYLSVFHDHHVHQEVESGRLKKVEFDWKRHVGPIGSLRITPHTATSLRLLQTFKARYGAAGFDCPVGAQKLVAAHPANGNASTGYYVRH